MSQNFEIFHFKREKSFFGYASTQSTAFETSFHFPGSKSVASGLSCLF